jgi:DNA-binding NtrC family response regulator
MQRILIVDDDRETCRFLEELLAEPGREFISAQGPDDAIARIRGEAFDLLISDINLGAPRSGLDLLRVFRTEHPDAPVVLISGFGTLETAIEAVRAGAFDYVSKPFDIADVRRIVAQALEQRRAVRRRPADIPPTPPAGLVGRTGPMLEVYKHIALAADSSSPVLIVGESGAGKELVARAIHTHGKRAREPFIAINCGAIVDSLLESELFGHTRGAFTGAIADRKGIFEQAGGGTVLLDEIGDTSAALQVKLLRVLEDGEVRPVGASRSIHTSARIIAATNVALEEAVSEGKFRQDLYYRLSVIVIRVPALRERRADIPLLIGRFLDEACARSGRSKVLSSEALDALMRHSWPGNVRELRNTIERLVTLSRGSTIEAFDLPQTVVGFTMTPDEKPFSDLPTLDDLERRYLLHVLDAVGGNRTRAAEILGIDRRTLYRMAERFGLELKD